MQITTEKRNIQYEYVRAFAIIAVVAIHTFNSAVIIFKNDASIIDVTIYRCIINSMWWAVPCFLMLSGKLLLDSNKRISLKKIYVKYILRMLVILFTFGWGFSWLEIFFDSKVINVREIIFALKNVLTGKTWAHMWYVYCLIGIYILLPVFKLIADYASDRELEYILSAWFVIGMLLHCIKIWNIDFGGYFHIDTIYPFWFLLGAAHNRKLLKGKKELAFGVGGITTAILSVASIIEVNKSISLEVFWGYASIIVAIQAISLFEIFISLNIEKGMVNRLILAIADKSFGIYVVHMVFVNIIYKVLKFNPFDTSAALLFGLFLVIINLIGSFCVVSIMRKIPFIKKYL
ncbi:MAG: acyltransferase [Lachnospiraceae bacterium]|nr:acyltransferase [Lachnospiraceae bacterium]MBR3807021.1 acyltransferase [Lachnospiraceae bacterium]